MINVRTESEYERLPSDCRIHAGQRRRRRSARRRGRSDTLAALIAARDMVPPLSIGLFDTIESGVSHFMRLVQHHIGRRAAGAGARGDDPFLCNVVQVEYNAWHYAGGN